MTTPFRFLAVSALAACLAAPLAQAQQNTQEEPDTLIISDTLTYDDNRKESVFTGNVVLTRGAMTLHSDKLTMREDAEGFQFGTATVEGGKLVFLRQENPEKFEVLEARGQRAEYDGLRVRDLAAQRGDRRATTGGRDDLTLPAVRRGGSALDKVGRYQVVDEVGQHGGVDAEPVGQRELARLWPTDDLAQGLVAAHAVRNLAQRGRQALAVRAKQRPQRPTEIRIRHGNRVAQIRC